MATRGGDATADPENAFPEDGGPIVAEEELALGSGEERLPWLESDDEYEQPGVDTGRIVAFAALGLLAVVLLVGALWLFLRDSSPSDAVADGSVIEAPDEPYRTRPDDPGGLRVEGTGQTSFEVAEGQRSEGQVADSALPAPSIDREQAGAAAPASGGVGVQVGAYSSREAAETGWSTLAARFEALQGRNHRVVEGVADSGRIFRLQALAGTVAEADELCRTLKAAGGDCQVKR
jgi:hypothetical protein